MNRTWRTLTLTLGLAALALSGLRAEDVQTVAPVPATPCCTGKACGKHGHDFRSWLGYGPIGRQFCGECSCLSPHGCRTPPLYIYFLDYPCPDSAGSQIALDHSGEGHLHYTKHACRSCASKSSCQSAEVVVPAEPKRMPPAETK
ncbi:MAG: hypothetical protein ACJ8FY_17845 [Gemmataceae bacterium]